MDSHDVIVIGLGGVGAQALWRLASRGARVLGLERFSLGHQRGSSHGGTRVTRHAYFEHADYVPLLRFSTRRFRELEAQTGQSLLEACGVLLLGRSGKRVCRCGHRLLRCKRIRRHSSSSEGVRRRGRRGRCERVRDGSCCRGRGLRREGIREGAGRRRRGEECGHLMPVGVDGIHHRVEGIGEGAGGGRGRHRSVERRRRCRRRSRAGRCRGRFPPPSPPCPRSRCSRRRCRAVSRCGRPGPRRRSRPGSNRRGAPIRWPPRPDRPRRARSGPGRPRPPGLPSSL